MSSIQDCLFCKIANKEIDSKMIFESDDVVAFLDINSASEGHTIVICKNHSNDLVSSNDLELSKLLVASKHVTKLLSNKLNVNNFNFLINQGPIAGQVINHLHLHIIPKYQKDIGFCYETKNNKENKIDLNETFNKIKSK